jgi:DegV family protein with EDD domain
VPLVAQSNWACVRKRQGVAAVSGWHHAVEQIDAAQDAFEQIDWSANAHQITRSISRQERRGDVEPVHLSAGISGTCESARQARQRLVDEGRGGERVHVYDSRSGAGGQGLVALAAAGAAGAGASGTEALAAAERCREALEMWFAIDTLEYLRKGGRIGAAQAWLGSALQIKPILTLGEEITPVERVRTRRRALERMVEYARRRHADGADGWVVQHIQNHDTARHLVEECRDIFGREPVFVSEVGPVIGAHVGPGMIGVGSVPTSLLG